MALARRYDAEIAAMHVISPVLPPLTSLPFPSPMPLAPEARESFAEALRSFAEPARTSGIPISCELREGNAATEILEKAKAWSADLLVMGTHGLGGFARWVLGSVTEKVLRRATCPVLTVPRPAVEGGSTPHALYKSILCPVDFSEASGRALKHALSLAAEAPARLIVINVIEGWAENLPPEHAHFSVPEYRRYLERDARDQLHALVPAEARATCHVEEVLAAGKTYREILRLAGERGVDLIVMGVHGRSPIDIMLFGSTTQHVVRAAACPVLTIRS
jgi:nucleotide-binding universal stress UspA family protein